MAGEFELIQRIFSGHDKAPGVSLGIGDDCALIRPSAAGELALTTDTMVEGRHFFKGTPPYYLGWRALAVNLSDLAAMGACPRYFLLSLTLPSGDQAWLEEFARGLFDLSSQAGIALVGGNMSKGELAITITAIGEVIPGQALLRSGAQPGDDLYVTGGLGCSGLHVQSGLGEIKLSPELEARACHDSFILPCRTEFAARLAAECGCRCAIDLSDGLVGDLGHIVEHSKVVASVWVDKLPLSPVLAEALSSGQVTEEQSLEHALYGGCDYELLFCLTPDRRAQLQDLAAGLKVPVSRIGRIESPRSRAAGTAGKEGSAIRLLQDDRELAIKPGFEHF